jgi:hypothetical protein
MHTDNEQSSAGHLRRGGSLGWDERLTNFRLGEIAQRPLKQVFLFPCIANDKNHPLGRIISHVTSSSSTDAKNIASVQSQ